MHAQWNSTTYVGPLSKRRDSEFQEKGLFQGMQFHTIGRYRKPVSSLASVEETFQQAVLIP